MSRYQLSKGAVISRTLLASVGGYALSLSFVAGGAALLARGFGMARGEAFMLAAMLAFLVWMLAVLVAYAAATSWRALGWILGSTVAWAVLAWWLGPVPGPGGV